MEGEGLVSPERAPSGYRRYSDQDIARLRYILEVQQKHYLPLKVIREHLEKLDAGEQPVSGTTSEPPPLEPVVTPTPPERQPQAKRPINIPRRELLRLSGLSENQLSELERHALVVPRRGTVQYGRDALTIAVAARKLAAYGMDARHLRAIKQAAEREASLIDQSLLTASIDHAMWFHRPVRADEWLLYDQASPSASGALGFAQGRLFGHNGVFGASCAQQGLIRLVDRA